MTSQGRRASAFSSSSLSPAVAAAAAAAAADDDDNSGDRVLFLTLVVVFFFLFFFSFPLNLLSFFLRHNSPVVSTSHLSFHLSRFCLPHPTTLLYLG